MEFEKACSEIDFILKNLNPEDKKKIPDVVIQFFKENKDMFYKVELDPTKQLSEQDLKDETKAFLQILKAKYFSTEDERREFIAKLNSEVEKIEQVEDNNYNSINTQNINEKKELVVYKENKLKILLRKIINFFKKQ